MRHVVPFLQIRGNAGRNNGIPFRQTAVPAGDILCHTAQYYRTDHAVHQQTFPAIEQTAKILMIYDFHHTCCNQRSHCHGDEHYGPADDGGLDHDTAADCHGADNIQLEGLFQLWKCKGKTGILALADVVQPIRQCQNHSCRSQRQQHTRKAVFHIMDCLFRPVSCQRVHR